VKNKEILRSKIGEKEAVKILHHYQKWRRGENIAMPDSKQIGLAIDVAIRVLRKAGRIRGSDRDGNIKKTTEMKTNPQFERLKKVIFEVTGIPFSEIAGKNRKTDVVYARMIYNFFCRKAGASLSDIASEIGCERSTILYSSRKYKDEYKFNPKFRKLAQGVEQAYGTIEKKSS
jgi:hypothetical protein